MHCPYKSIQLTIKKFIIAMSIIGNIIEFSSWISPVLNRVCLHQIIPLTISIDHFQNLLEKILMVSTIYTLSHMFTQFCLFMMLNAYVLEGGNEGGREVTPTSISIFDFYGIKTLWFEFGNAIFAGFKIPRL